MKINFAQWFVVMKFSLPVIRLEELFKWVVRNYTNGKDTGNLSKLFVIFATEITTDSLKLPVSLLSA